MCADARAGTRWLPRTSCGTFRSHRLAPGERPDACGVDVIQLADRRADRGRVRGRSAGRRIPARALTVKWAVRLRAAVPELHISQGTLPPTTGWLDEYFAGSPALSLSPSTCAAGSICHQHKLQSSRRSKDPSGRDPLLRRCRQGHRTAPATNRLAGLGQPPGHPDPVPPGGGQGRRTGGIRWRSRPQALVAGPRAEGRRRGLTVGHIDIRPY